MENKIQDLKSTPTVYHWSDLIFRKDEQTGELCLFTCETQSTGKNEIYVRETNVEKPNNVIQWIGRQLPARPKWARNYINKADYERYGVMYHRREIFEEYVGPYDENGTYTEEGLIALINSINRKRNRKRIVNKQEREIGE